MGMELHINNGWILSNGICVRRGGKAISYGALFFTDKGNVPHVIGMGELSLFFKCIDKLTFYDKAWIDNVDTTVNPKLHVNNNEINIEIIDVFWKTVPKNDNALVKKAYVEHSGWDADRIKTLSRKQMLQRFIVK